MIWFCSVQLYWHASEVLGQSVPESLDSSGNLSSRFFILLKSSTLTLLLISFLLAHGTATALCKLRSVCRERICCPGMTVHPPGATIWIEMGPVGRYKLYRIWNRKVYFYRTWLDRGLGQPHSQDTSPGIVYYQRGSGPAFHCRLPTRSIASVNQCIGEPLVSTPNQSL